MRPRARRTTWEQSGKDDRVEPQLSSEIKRRSNERNDCIKQVTTKTEELAARMGKLEAACKVKGNSLTGQNEQSQS